jgi:hypothetical protein
MAQLDDDVGLLMQKLKDMGVDGNTIVVFTPSATRYRASPNGSSPAPILTGTRSLLQ